MSSTNKGEDEMKPLNNSELLEKINYLVGSAVLKNDKNYSNDIFKLIKADRLALLTQVQTRLPKKPTGHNKDELCCDSCDVIDQVNTILDEIKEEIK